MDVNKENPEIDTAAAATEAEAKVVDTAAEVVKEVPVSDDEAILAAIRGEEAPKEDKPKDEQVKVEGEAPKTDEVKTDEQSALDKENSDDMKGRTKERFDTVLAEGKKWRDEANTYKQQIEESRPQAEWSGQVIRMLGDSGGTAEDLAAGIGIIHAVVRGTTENKVRALEEVEKIRVTLATQLGRPINGVSHISEFSDLQKMVDEGEISPAAAEELAATRKANKLRQERETQDQLAQREKFDNDTAVGQHQQALQQATQTIDGLVAQYLKADGQVVFDTRVQYALNQVKLLKEMGTSVEPAKLPDLFTRFYKSQEADTLVQAKAVARARVTTGAKPLMGSRMGGNGQASKEHTSMDDAILAALHGE